MFNIKGPVFRTEPMWRHTTFLIGGPADLFALPSDEEDLRSLFTAARRDGLEIFILGGGSNILVSDSGIRGLVIDTRLFNDYRENYREEPEAASPGELTLILGAGLPVSDAAWKSGSSGLAGLDFLFGMPGTVGGAIWMNARCYDAEIADTLIWVDVMDRGGKVTRIPMNRNDWAYKHSPFQNGSGAELTILRAAFVMNSKDPDLLKAAMMEKRDDRVLKGHYKAPCAGSAFKNNRAFGSPSGKLIDSCGLKGFKIGAAAVADWHANIIINEGSAGGNDIRRLLEEIARKVKESTGFLMEREVLMVGDWDNG